ncbi:MAG: (Fe-S)-binding protein [Flavobacteriaceae bacterium]|nr:(Fe-S)-binding protein [Flavobacteriaceae bacterium]
MEKLAQLFFLIVLAIGLGFFLFNLKRIRKNILKGRPVSRNDQKALRWRHVLYLALGQNKMLSKPVSGILHLVVYFGFIIINIELFEITLDGLLGTHRLFAPILGSSYAFLIGSFEILAFGVLLAAIVFWIRRNLIRLQRFWKPEMKGWPKKDADYILYFEIVLMFLFLSMNATDSLLQGQHPDYLTAGAFPISQFLTPLFDDLSVTMLVLFERSFWWLHILGILFFLNYLNYSKHLHILLGFPNVYYANLKPYGSFPVDGSITSEVKMLLNFPTDEGSPEEIPERFGAKDVTDLNWVQLMNAYSCTECGRCTDVCPANLSGKKLSPRKIMMDTRDRLASLDNKKEANGTEKYLLDGYISREELWACTSCNACVEACPIAIDPLSIIMDMRKYLVMEQSAAPAELNNMMSNIENNGAPWPYSQKDRLLWSQELINK